MDYFSVATAIVTSHEEARRNLAALKVESDRLMHVAREMDWLAKQPPIRRPVYTGGDNYDEDLHENP